jgi:hypothetical protein
VIPLVWDDRCGDCVVAGAVVEMVVVARMVP